MTKLTKEQQELLDTWPKLLYRQCENLIDGTDVMIADINIFVKALLEAKDAEKADAVEKERDLIKELQSALCFMAHCYQVNFEKFHEEPLRKASTGKMTPEEEDRVMSFATVQGMRSRLEVKKLAALWEKMPNKRSGFQRIINSIITQNDQQ